MIRILGPQWGHPLSTQNFPISKVYSQQKQIPVKVDKT